MEALDILDSEFLRFLFCIEKEYQYITDKSVRIRIERWCLKLSEESIHEEWRKNRNEYADTLLYWIRKREFPSPFDKSPPEHQLPNLHAFQKRSCKAPPRRKSRIRESISPENHRKDSHDMKWNGIVKNLLYCANPVTSELLDNVDSVEFVEQSVSSGTNPQLDTAHADSAVSQLPSRANSGGSYGRTDSVGTRYNMISAFVDDKQTADVQMTKPPVSSQVLPGDVGRNRSISRGKGIKVVDLEVLPVNSESYAMNDDASKKYSLDHEVKQPHIPACVYSASTSQNSTSANPTTSVSASFPLQSTPLVQSMSKEPTDRLDRSRPVYQLSNPEQERKENAIESDFSRNARLIKKAVTEASEVSQLVNVLKSQVTFMESEINSLRTLKKTIEGDSKNMQKVNADKKMSMLPSKSELQQPNSPTKGSVYHKLIREKNLKVGKTSQSESSSNGSANESRSPKVLVVERNVSASAFQQKHYIPSYMKRPAPVPQYHNIYDVNYLREDTFENSNNFDLRPSNDRSCHSADTQYDQLGIEEQIHPHLVLPGSYISNGNSVEVGSTSGGQHIFNDHRRQSAICGANPVWNERIVPLVIPINSYMSEDN